MSKKTVEKDIIEMEMKALLESTALMLKETKRLKDEYDTDDFNRGRYEGIVIATMDALDNFARFGSRIGVKPTQKDKNE